jgi:hypothetical protein
MFCDGLSIVNFVRRNFPDQILGTLDAFLVEEYQECSRANLEEENEIHQCLLSLVKVALSCAYTDTDVHTGEGLRPYGHMRPYGVWTEDV